MNSPTISGQQRSSPLAGFLRWWGGELASLVPGRLAGPRLLMRLDGGQLNVVMAERGGERAIAHTRVDEDGRPVSAPALGRAAEDAADAAELVLELDPGRVLVRRIRVARAAEAELAGVLSFEVERHTPFRAGETVFAWRLDPGHSDSEHLGIVLFVVPRRVLDPVLDGLAAQGLAPTRVVARPGGDENPVDLPAAAAPPRRAVAGPAGLIAVTLLLLAGALVSPVLRVEAAAERRAAEAAAVGAATEALAGDSRAQAQAVRGARLIEETRAGRPTALAVLDGLSDLLPDGTWLLRLTLGGGEVQLEGRTGSAVDLVGRLEGSPLFERVSYAAPVTRDAAGGEERFGFTLDLAGQGAR